LADDWAALRYGQPVRDPDACTRGLAAEAPAVWVGVGDAPTGFRAVERYVAVPSLARPQVLLPDGAARASQRGLTRFAHGSARPARVASGALALAVRGGALAALRRNRLTLAVSDDTPPGELEHLLLRPHLEHALGRAPLRLAVRVGALRPNGKPVVQVMDEGGDALGFAKIGWNELTRPLVAREADVLNRLGRPAQAAASFVTPRLLHRGTWSGFELLLVEPIAQGGEPVGPVPPIEATRDVAGLGDVSHGPLGTSAWWADVGARLAAVDHPRLAADVRAVEARFGDRKLAFGGCHGDWTPWNMARLGGRLTVWDWERFRADAPVGQDAAHFLFMVALRQRKEGPDGARASTLAALPPLLEPLGADPADAELLLMLHQLEMGIRFAEARAAGVRVLHDLFADGLHALLTAR
jgi:hypothetical protein